MPGAVSQPDFDAVCEAMATGMSARKACEQVGVHPGCFWACLAVYDRGEPTEKGLVAAERRDQYIRARDAALHAMADAVIDIADAVDEERGAAVNKARLQVDSRRWLLSKLAPKVYGDKVDVEHKGNVTLQLSKDDAAL